MTAAAPPGPPPSPPPGSRGSGSPRWPRGRGGRAVSCPWRRLPAGSPGLCRPWPPRRRRFCHCESDVVGVQTIPRIMPEQFLTRLNVTVRSFGRQVRLGDVNATAGRGRAPELPRATGMPGQGGSPAPWPSLCVSRQRARCGVNWVILRHRSPH